VAQTRILIVAQAFKGTLSVAEVAEALQRAADGTSSNIRTIMGSDGGDGLLEAVQGSVGRRGQMVVAGQFGDPVKAPFAWLDDRTVILESRLICGLSLTRPEIRNPLRASSRGVGEAIREAAGEGASTVVVGLGGSATVDGGTGMARALGWRFLGAAGRELPEGGGALAELERGLPGPPLSVRVTGLADVRNRLTGPDGAVVYAPQKGADPAAVTRLGLGLDRLVDVLAADDPRAQARANAVSAGAAGGLGFGLLHFAAAELVSGASWVLERAGFDAALRQADLVVTGEGAFDATSWEGKLTGEVLGRARAAGVPVALLAPRATGVPDGVVVETGGGEWTGDALARRAARAMRRALRLPLS
jgi:glycerate kinase